MAAPDRGRNLVHFSLSTNSSPFSSRNSSPASALKYSFDDPAFPPPYSDTVYDAQNELNAVYTTEKQDYYLGDKIYSDNDPTPGRLPSDVYDATLPWWRAAIRRTLVKTVHKESSVLARMQDLIRTPWLDAYFVYTSSLGTHTFFMTVLPALFFFGYEETGRGLLIVLALGVYISSVVKDLICSPRPFAPPVTRLTIGSHHLEYGFPSTHSTNSVSIALLLFSHVHRLSSVPSAPIAIDSSIATNSSIFETTWERDVPAISLPTYYVLSALLAMYTFSIVFGRLYTAMHSFTDCAMGVFLGATIWFVFDSSAESGLGMGVGLGGGLWVENWVREGSWGVPALLVPLCLFMVNQHPQPVDDCPCFEDAIAFVSVLMGSLVARWHAVHWGFTGAFFSHVMPGSLSSAGEVRGWEDVGLWWGVAALKMVVGILTIFTWRLLAKSALHLVLPPTFRLLARGFRLPNRRFYTPATDYKNVPSEFAGGGLNALRTVPSVIDLPAGGVEVDDGEWERPEVSGVRGGGSGMKMRGAAPGTDEKRAVPARWVERSGNGRAGVRPPTKSDRNGDAVKHYDADVLTKVIVYCGIAVLACEALPVLFEIVGWGVRSWT